MTARPRILYLMHSYYKGAGTEQHCETVVRRLHDEFEPYVVVPNEGKFCVIKDDKVIFERTCAEAPFPVTPYGIPAISKITKEILALIKPDLIHIQHFARWPLSVIDELIETGLPVVMSFHDFYTITPEFTMQGVKNVKEVLSTDYAKQIFGSDVSPYLKERFESVGKSLLRLTSRIVPSHFMKEEMERAFSVEFKVIEHGIEPFTPVTRKTDPDHLTFGFVGNLLPQKGWRILLDAFQLLRAEFSNVKLNFYGGVEKLESDPNRGVRSFGYYSREKLPEIFASLDVGVIPSIFREPYCLVLSEMWQGGLPLAVSDIGALGERVKDGVNGKKFIPGDSKSLYTTLKWFLLNNEWRSWTLPRPRLADEMAQEYQTLYRELV